MQKGWNSIACSVTAAMFLAACQTSGGGFGGSAEAPRGTPEQLTERGIAAAQGGEVGEALRLLLAAVDQSGPNPVSVFNLGLIQAKAGNAVAASAWLRTYLAMAPDAANAAPVRAEIRTLDARADAGLDAILDAAIDAVVRLPDIPRPSGLEPEKIRAFSSVTYRAQSLGRSAAIDRLNRELPGVGKRLGYKVAPVTFSRSDAWRLQRAAGSGDVAEALRVWPRLKPGGEDWAHISPISSLGQYASLEAAQAFSAAPKDFQSAVAASLQYTVHDLVRNGHGRDAEVLYTHVRGNGRDTAALFAAEAALARGDFAAARQWAGKCRSTLPRCAGLSGNARQLADAWQKANINTLVPHNDYVVEYTGRFLALGDGAGVAAMQAIFPGEEAKYARDRYVATRCTTCPASAALRRQFMRIYADLARGDFAGVDAFLATSNTWIWRRRDDFVDDVLGAALAQGKLDYATSWIGREYPLRRQPDLFERSARRAAELGQPERAASLRKHASALRTRLRGGWSPRDEAHLHRVETWFRHALAVQHDDDTGNVGKALDVARKQTGDQVVAEILRIALLWDRAVERTRILEQLLPVLR